MQSAGCQGTGTSNYVIAHARARFANALGLEMKSMELIPNKMAGKPEAEIRGQSIALKMLSCPGPVYSPASLAVITSIALPQRNFIVAGFPQFALDCRTPPLSKLPLFQ